MAEQCPDCNNTFSTNQSLKVHYDTMHLQLKPFKCRICTKEFAQKGNLKNHSCIKELTCHLCDMVCKTKFNLTSHINSVHLLKLRRYCCDPCNKTFSRRAYLVKHISVEKCDNVYKKVYKNKTTGTSKKSDLRKKKKMARIFYQNRPILRSSLGKKVTSKPKPWSCDKCDKSFSRHLRLKMHHSAVHVIDNKFKCKFCDSEFLWKSNLTAHITSKHLLSRLNGRCLSCKKQTGPRLNYLCMDCSPGLTPIVIINIDIDLEHNEAIEVDTEDFEEEIDDVEQVLEQEIQDAEPEHDLDFQPDQVINDDVIEIEEFNLEHHGAIEVNTEGFEEEEIDDVEQVLEQEIQDAESEHDLDLQPDQVINDDLIEIEEFNNDIDIEHHETIEFEEEEIDDAEPVLEQEIQDAEPDKDDLDFQPDQVNNDEEEFKVNPEDFKKLCLKYQNFQKHERPVQCRHCFKHFFSQQRLKRHVKVLHNQVVKFECDKCQDKFNWRIRLIQHVRKNHKNHHDPQESVNPEDFKKLCLKYQNFQKHQRPVQCRHCFKHFVSQQRLKRHVKVLHNQVVKFECDKCQDKFNGRIQLIKHVRKNHKNHHDPQESVESNLDIKMTSVPVNEYQLETESPKNQFETTAVQVGQDKIEPVQEELWIPVNPSYVVVNEFGVPIAPELPHLLPISTDYDYEHCQDLINSPYVELVNAAISASYNTSHQVHLDYKETSTQHQVVGLSSTNQDQLLEFRSNQDHLIDFGSINQYQTANMLNNDVKPSLKQLKNLINRPFHCHVCQKCFTRKDTVVRHLKAVHKVSPEDIKKELETDQQPQMSKIFRCLQCPFLTKDSRKIIEHHLENHTHIEVVS
jgi:hypothetical protein